MIPNITRSIQAHYLPQVLASVLLAFASTSCSSTEVINTNSNPPKVARIPIEDSLRLDVMILPFDPNVEELEKNSGDIPASKEVREAESRYQAFHLKETLEQTGNWGVVRVIPGPASYQPLLVEGKILVSDGESLVLEIRATDASGKVWVNKKYSDAASKYSYQTVKEDPFQDLYNRIADDLLDIHRGAEASSINNIQKVAQLKFAGDLSPELVTNYLAQDKQGYMWASQMPAQNDAVMIRVEKLRVQENLFVDAMDDYYLNFYRNVKPSYDEWRYATYDEAVRLRQMQKQARGRLLTGAALIAGGLVAGSKSKSWAGNAAATGAVVGGIAAVKSGVDRYKAAEIHEQALSELTQSLGMEITPNVLEIEGQTVELKGNVDTQYAEWRRILREIYVRDRGQQ